MSTKKDEKSLAKYNPLEEIELSEEEQTLLLAKTGATAAIEMVPYVGGLIGLTNKFSDALDKKKLEKLLVILREKMNSQEQFSAAINKLITNVYGLTLFQKTIQILRKDNNEDFIELLSNVVHNICREDFERMFDQLNYILSQIEKLSAQALLLISKYEEWKGIRLERATGMGSGIICPDWDSQLTMYFVNKMGLSDQGKITRINHAFHELESNGIIHTTRETKSVDLTNIGREVYEKIIPNESARTGS